ncbi:hypothetical protein [Anaerotignum sp.]|uniref:hypothetical protein n=2 Tax=Anaerotignum sp. TaxID=2039241 RepID=UPI002A90A689|nr:hypothetical protein [Anaerotignum sp.]MCI7656435.1 hypothetical protein [Clostridia bacterium]MDY5416187.1 hypothetical protein [Anaerotignum sp.]
MEKMDDFGGYVLSTEKRVDFIGYPLVILCKRKRKALKISVFLQKNLYEFSERGYNGTKGEILISRIGG